MSQFLELPEFQELLDLPETYILENLMTIPTTGELSRIAKIFLRTIAQAVVCKASDIYINARRGEAFINIAVGNSLYLYPFPGKESQIKSKLVSLCGIPDGACHSDLLKGRFSMEFPPEWAIYQGLTPLVKSNGDLENYLIDFRVQIQKTADGWSAAIRLFDDQLTHDLDSMNLPKSVVATIKQIVASKTGGIITVTGPTCSGKSTTLHAILSHLNDGKTPIFTISDPHERTLRGYGPITHWEVTGQHSALDGLHAALRSRPRVIMVAEVRTSEEMEVVLQAAATGQIVLVTWHANNAIEGITRAVDLTLDKTRDAYRVAELLKLVVTQRLIPSYKPTQQLQRASVDQRDWLKDNGIAGELVRVPSNEFIRSMPIVECVKVDLNIKRLIKSQLIDQEHLFAAVKDQVQFETLAQCAWRYIENGQVDIDEAMSWSDVQLLASVHETARAKLVRQYGATYSEVNTAIDTWLSEREVHESQSIEDALKKTILIDAQAQNILSISAA